MLYHQLAPASLKFRDVLCRITQYVVQFCSIYSLAIAPAVYSHTMLSRIAVINFALPLCLIANIIPLIIIIIATGLLYEQCLSLCTCITFARPKIRRLINATFMRGWSYFFCCCYCCVGDTHLIGLISRISFNVDFPRQIPLQTILIILMETN